MQIEGPLLSALWREYEDPAVITFPAMPCYLCRECKHWENNSNPNAYLNLSEVFSKTKPNYHQPWVCAIDLHPGATPQSGRASNPEKREIEAYISKAPALSYIHHSTSLATASSFVKKKGGGQRPYIDYRYPLPLVPWGSLVAS